MWSPVFGFFEVYFGLRAQNQSLAVEGTWADVGVCFGWTQLRCLGFSSWSCGAAAAERDVTLLLFVSSPIRLHLVGAGLTGLFLLLVSSEDLPVNDLSFISLSSSGRPVL